MSAIVRSLVTKLSFTFDRTNLDKFEKSVSKFKTTFALATAGVTGFVAALFNSVTAFADAAVYAKDIANYSGLALEDFKGLQLVTQNFGIKENDFINFFTNLADNLQKASQGIPTILHDIARESNGILNFRNLDESIKTPLEYIQAISDALKTVPSLSNQLKILESFPGINIENVGRWQEFFAQSKESITAQIEGQREAAKAFADSIPDAKKYQQELSILSTEWQKFTNTLKISLVPVLGQVLGGVNDIIESFKKLGSLETFKEIGKSIFKTSLPIFAGPVVSGVAKSAYDFVSGLDSNDFTQESVGRFIDKIERQLFSPSNSQNSANVTNNNSFTFEVPPGTTETQATFITEQVKQTLQGFWNQEVRQIFNNNPQVEYGP